MDPQVNASRPQQTSATPYDVATLTRKLTHGDEAAYREFFDRYYGRLFRYLCVIANGDEHVAREALQTALDRLVRYVRRFDDERVFWSWLTVLARTAFLDQHRKRKRYFGFLERFRTGTAPAIFSDPRDTDAELQESLQRALQLLPADERQLLEWKYNEHRTVDAIATSLGVSPKAVESRLSRVREKLKQLVLGQLSHD